MASNPTRRRSPTLCDLYLPGHELHFIQIKKCIDHKRFVAGTLLAVKGLDLTVELPRASAPTGPTGPVGSRGWSASAVPCTSTSATGSSAMLPPAPRDGLVHRPPRTSGRRAPLRHCE